MWLAICNKSNGDKINKAQHDTCRDRQSCKVSSMCEIKLRLSQIFLRVAQLV
jgi:hypothetical protein